MCDSILFYHCSRYLISFDTTVVRELYQAGLHIIGVREANQTIIVPQQQKLIMKSLVRYVYIFQPKSVVRQIP